MISFCKTCQTDFCHTSLPYQFLLRYQEKRLHASVEVVTNGVPASDIFFFCSIFCFKLNGWTFCEGLNTIWWHCVLYWCAQMCVEEKLVYIIMKSKPLPHYFRKQKSCFFFQPRWDVPSFHWRIQILSIKSSKIQLNICTCTWMRNIPRSTCFLSTGKVLVYLYELWLSVVRFKE